MKMHDGEAELDAALVGRLVAAQFPDLAGLPVTGVRSTGTVNAIYRLGEQFYARLPLVPRFVRALEREWRWLPELAPCLTLRIPEPVALGQPAAGYPSTWAVYRWLDGRPYADQLVDDERQAARDLARFVTELRRIPPPADAPAAAGDVIDGPAALAAWEHARRAPAWDGQPCWIHSDLLRPNLLVAAGRLGAVIDFGGVGVGDPATDVIPAWAVFGPAGRRAFRAALDVDEATWARARGIALHQAAALVPYYAVSNPAFADLGRRTVAEVVADLRAD